MPLYEEVVDAHRAACGFRHGDLAYGTHLESLSSALRELRLSFQTGGGSVAVTYTRAVTEAYLLAYFPHYVRLTRAALNTLPDGALRDGRNLRVCAFACGPAPEPLALSNFLRHRGFGTSVLDLDLLDLVPERWEWARRVAIEGVLPTRWPHEATVHSTVAVDITKPHLVGQALGAVERADLVMFQNCLNEFPPDPALVRENAEEVVGAMAPGSVLLMADLHYYPTARMCLEIFEEVAHHRATVLHSCDRVLTSSPAPDRPRVLDEHFFYRGGQWPRRRDYEFLCLAAQIPVS